MNTCQTLAYRADLLFTYKLVFGIINLKLSDFSFLIFTELTAASDTNYSFRSNSHPYRVLSIWNELTSHETDFNSLVSFKYNI